jgi:hypothetical protein
MSIKYPPQLVWSIKCDDAAKKNEDDVASTLVFFFVSFESTNQITLVVQCFFFN